MVEARAAALKVKENVSVGALRMILSRFNAQKFGELQDADYKPFYDACMARIAEGK